MPEDFLEKTLEDLIFENRHTIHEKGLPRFKAKTYRQFHLPSGRKVDIITMSFNLGYIEINIYELKKDIIDTASICQAYNYAHEIQSLISGYFNGCEIKMVMVGKRYEPISLLNAVNIDLEVYTYDYQLNGLQFTKRDALIKDFPPNHIFANALYAWMHSITYTHGIPSSVRLLNEYLTYVNENPEFDARMEKERSSYLQEIKLLPPSTTYLPSYIQPEQPSSFQYLFTEYDDLNPTYETNE